jgi:pimeloyl-ACP methyl ester carboxylesterase
MAGDDPEQRFVEREGLRIAVLDWGGDGEPLLLLHPTGFCAGLFDPLARRLRDRFRPIGVDARGHGASDAPSGLAGYSFAHVAADVAAVVDELGVARCAALGESLGGGVALLLDAMRPGLLRRVMLCEGIAFDPGGVPRERPVGAEEGSNPMAEGARRRRPVWPDRDTVRASYAARPPLDALAPEALDAYLRWGFVDRDDGQVELACSPEDEARTFEAAMLPDGAPGAWAHLEMTTCPVVVLYGDASDLPGPWFEAQAERAGAPAVVVHGGHLFLQEDTARAEALVREHLA